MSFNCPLSFIEALNNFGGGQDRYAVAAQSGNTLLELTLLDHQRYQGTPPTETQSPDICTASEGIKLTRVHHGFARAGALGVAQAVRTMQRR